MTREGRKETEKDRPKKPGQAGQGESQQRNSSGIWQLGGMVSVIYED